MAYSSRYSPGASSWSLRFARVGRRKREEASDADEGALLVSRAFKEGSVAWRMANLSLGELAAQRAAAKAFTGWFDSR
jgi:hypothetical protein